MTKTVQVISTENIKPSSPTPPHLRTFNLSLLDQAVQHCYAPIIFYYSAGGTESMLRRLKTSLAQTLTRFYPLSGRIKENGLQVDCNDAGVEFTEARVRARLPDFLRRPCVDVVNQLSPSSLWRTRTGRSDVLLAIQVSRFECGGISIALCTSHKIADGASYATFFMAWAAATSRRVGGAQAVSPSFQASTLFPNPKGPPAEVKAVFTKDNIVCSFRETQSGGAQISIASHARRSGVCAHMEDCDEDEQREGVGGDGMGELAVEDVAAGADPLLWEHGCSCHCSRRRRRMRGRRHRLAALFGGEAEGSNENSGREFHRRIAKGTPKDYKRV